MGDRVGITNWHRGTRLVVAGSVALLIIIGVLTAPTMSAQATTQEPTPVVIPNADFSAGVKPWTPSSLASMTVDRTYSTKVGHVRRTATRSGTVFAASRTSQTTFVAGTEVEVEVALRSTKAHGQMTIYLYEKAPDGTIRQWRSAGLRQAQTTYREFRNTIVIRDSGSTVFARFYHTAARKGQALRIKDIETRVEPSAPSPDPSPTASTPSPTATTPPVVPTPTTTPPTPEPTECRDRDYRDPRIGRLSFADEFSGNAVDTSRWRVRDKDHLSFDAAYLQKENVTVSGGMLTIAGRRMSSPKTVSTGLRERWYSTGYLDTIGTFSQKYGRWEMRAKVPTDGTRTRGVWPAFWLRGDKTAGEIDIMETYGSPDTQDRWNPSNSYESTIWRDTNVGGQDKWHARSHPFNHTPAIYEDFHVYGLNWSPECLTFTFDDTVIGHVKVADVPWMAAALDSPFNIRLNMQVGSSYWGMPDTTNTKPAFDYLVDYVRAYAPVQ